MCMKNEKTWLLSYGYPTVMLRLSFGMVSIQYRKWNGNGSGMEWRRGERKRCGERLREDRRETKKRKNAEK